MPLTWRAKASAQYEHRPRVGGLRFGVGQREPKMFGRAVAGLRKIDVRYLVLAARGQRPANRRAPLLAASLPLPLPSAPSGGRFVNQRRPGPARVGAALDAHLGARVEPLTLAPHVLARGDDQGLEATLDVAREVLAQRAELGVLVVGSGFGFAGSGAISPSSDAAAAFGAAGAAPAVDPEAMGRAQVMFSAPTTHRSDAGRETRRATNETDETEPEAWARIVAQDRARVGEGRGSARRHALKHRNPCQ